MILMFLLTLIIYFKKFSIGSCQRREGSKGDGGGVSKGWSIIYILPECYRIHIYVMIKDIVDQIEWGQVGILHVQNHTKLICVNNFYVFTGNTNECRQLQAENCHVLNARIFRYLMLNETNHFIYITTPGPFSLFYSLREIWRIYLREFDV